MHFGGVREDYPDTDGTKFATYSPYFKNFKSFLEIFV